MASPKYQTFAIYDNTTGAPLAGVGIGAAANQIHFESYTNEAGTPLTRPTIVEIGNGVYGFIPTFTTDHLIEYVVATGANTPLHYFDQIRPETYYVDGLGTSSGMTITGMLQKLLNFFGI